MAIDKRDIITNVCDTAMHILHESNLYQSDLWPQKGFKAGYVGDEDCIGYCVNAYGHELTPITGRLVIYGASTNESRLYRQFDQIKTVLDYAYYNDFLFEDEFRNASFSHNYVWFKFTYTPKLTN